MKIINTLVISGFLFISSIGLVQATVEHNTHINHHMIQTSSEFQNHSTARCTPNDPRC